VATRNAETEERVVRLFALEETDLIRSPEDSVARACTMQDEKVADREEDLALREEP